MSVTWVAVHSKPIPPMRSSFSKLSVTSPTSQLILQHFSRFTYVTAHSPTLPSLYLRQNSFSNPSVISPTSQFILQSFRFSYVISSSVNSPGEPSMLLSEVFYYLLWDWVCVLCVCVFLCRKRCHF